MEKNSFGKTSPKEIIEEADGFAQIAGAFPYLRKVIDLDRVYGLLNSAYLIGVRDGKASISGTEDDCAAVMNGEIQMRILKEVIDSIHCPDVETSFPGEKNTCGRFDGFMASAELKKELEKGFEESLKKRSETK